MATVDEVWATNAGAHLFNGLSKGHWVDERGNRLYFSKKYELTKRFIGMLLEARVLPEEFKDQLKQLGDER